MPEVQLLALTVLHLAMVLHGVQMWADSVGGLVVRHADIQGALQYKGALQYNTGTTSGQ